MGKVQGQHKLYHFRRLIRKAADPDPPGSAVFGNPDNGNKGQDAQERGKDNEKGNKGTHELKGDNGRYHKEQRPYAAIDKLPRDKIKLVSHNALSGTYGRGIKSYQPCPQKDDNARDENMIGYYFSYRPFRIKYIRHYILL
jgi:hypothetical protein